MRSCEYTLTPKHEEKETKLLELHDIIFLTKNHMVIPHVDPLLSQKAYALVITFRSQKNGVKNEKVYNLRSGCRLCPVKIWSKIVQRIWSYPSSTVKTTVNTVFLHTKNRMNYSLLQKS